MRLLGLLKLPELHVVCIMIQLQGFGGGMWWFEGKWYPKHYFVTHLCSQTIGLQISEFVVSRTYNFV